jgi:hypothetical protein
MEDKMMDKSAMKEKMKGKMNAVLEDVEAAEISKSIDSIKQTDGKITADFCVSGLPTDEKQAKKSNMPTVYESSYRRYPKIFDSWKEFSEYAEEFFATDFEKYE